MSVVGKALAHMKWSPQWWPGARRRLERLAAGAAQRGSLHVIRRTTTAQRAGTTVAALSSTHVTHNIKGLDSPAFWGAGDGGSR